MKYTKKSVKIRYKGGVFLKTWLEKVIRNSNVYKYVGYLLVLVAVILVIVSFIPTNSVKTTSQNLIIRNSESEVTEEAVEAIEDNKSEPQTQSVKTFSKDAYPAINMLIANYYNALIADDDTLLGKYTDSVEDISEYTRNVNVMYVESYSNIECYSVTGIVDETYVVAVKSNIKYKDIDTKVSNIDYFYIGTDLSDNIYIMNKPISDEASSYNELMYQNNIITELAQQVKLENGLQVASDAKLQELMENLKNLD